MARPEDERIRLDEGDDGSLPAEFTLITPLMTDVKKAAIAAGTNPEVDLPENLSLEELKRAFAIATYQTEFAAIQEHGQQPPRALPGGWTRSSEIDSDGQLVVHLGRKSGRRGPQQEATITYRPKQAGALQEQIMITQIDGLETTTAGLSLKDAGKYRFTLLEGSQKGNVSSLSLDVLGNPPGSSKKPFTLSLLSRRGITVV